MYDKNTHILLEKKKLNLKKYLKILLISFSIIIIINIIFNKNTTNTEHLAIIELIGDITEKNNKADVVINNIQNALNNKNCKAIIIKINSPGGTPVQSNIIHNYIKKTRNLNDKKIFSVIEDIGTSGAYLIATATEKIYCDPSSIVGSIGVIMTSFGFFELFKKLGIERRIYVAGKNKSIMDPFVEKNKNDEIIIQKNLEIIHDNFINTVKKNRPNIQIDSESDIFSGKFWIGKEALEIGLIDGFYDIYTLSSEMLEISNIIYYNKNSNILNKLLNYFK